MHPGDDGAIDLRARDASGPERDEGTFPLGPLIAFVERSAGGQVIGTPRALTGGVASEVYAMAVAVGGRARRVVARRYVRPMRMPVSWDTMVGREAATLSQLERTGLPVPRLLGFDGTGAEAGTPALVMTRLVGRIDLRPKDHRRWLEALARTLAEIHGTGLAAPPYEGPWLDPDSAEVPLDANRPDLWRAALELVRTPAPSGLRGFVHGDYQHFNVLWRGDQLSGVLDWTRSWTGAPEIDVAHTRLNLVALFDVERAELFRHAYEAITGQPTDPWWDAAELLCYEPGWPCLRHQVGRRLRVDSAGMTARVEALLERVLARS